MTQRSSKESQKVIEAPQSSESIHLIVKLGLKEEDYLDFLEEPVEF